MSTVPVDPTDLRIVLDQQSGHAHRRPGIWDPDNLLGRANTRCVECAARDRLRAALDAWSAAPASAGAPEAPPKDLPLCPGCQVQHGPPLHYDAAMEDR